MALGRQSSAQRSVHLIPPEGNEPREGVFVSCCETSIVCLRAGSCVALGWLCLSARPHDVVAAGSFDSGFCLASRPRAVNGAPRGDDTRKRGHLGGRSVACDRPFDPWMPAVRRKLTIGDDRPVIGRRSVGVSLPRSESNPTGTVMRRLAFFGRSGRRLAAYVSNDYRRACVLLTTSSPPRAPFP
jgi:hypothetical protein